MPILFLADWTGLLHREDYIAYAHRDERWVHAPDDSHHSTGGSRLS